MALEAQGDEKMQYYVDYRSMQLRMKRHIAKFARYGEYKKYNDYLKQCENCKDIYKLNEMMRKITIDLNKLEEE